MKIFNIFKKKKKDLNFPENELEKYLVKASMDVSARKSFYTKLLWNEIFILAESDNEQTKGKTILEKDTTVKFITFEKGEIPIFTSTNRIFDKGVIKEEVPFIAMKGQDLFGMTRGATFILNPYSEYGKELIPQEIESLLDGSIFEQKNEVIIEKDTDVLIGQPAQIPKELIKALSKFFEEHDNVNKAYLANIKIGKTDEELPHLIIGIDLEGEISSITNKSIALAELYLGKNEIVDFIKIENDGGISDYFLNSTKPFYKRNY